MNKNHSDNNESLKSNSKLETRNLYLPNEVLIPEIIKFMEEGHTVTLLLRGFSMRPFLEDNRDKALLRKATDPKVGDAVLAEIEPKHYVLHRIDKIVGDKVTLRGDGNLDTEQCRLIDVKGTAIGFYRKGRSKPDRTDGKKWRIYSWLWTRLLPLRRYLLGAYRRVWIPIFGPI